MPVERIDRLNEELRHVIDSVIREEVSDPRVAGLFSIVGVEVTRDLSLAKVRVSRMGDPKDMKEMIKALERASSFIRRGVKQRMSLRSVPELSFVPDDGISYSVEIGRKIDQLMKEQNPQDDAQGEPQPSPRMDEEVG